MRRKSHGFRIGDRVRWVKNGEITEFVGTVVFIYNNDIYCSHRYVVDFGEQVHKSFHPCGGRCNRGLNMFDTIGQWQAVLDEPIEVNIPKDERYSSLFI